MRQTLNYPILTLAALLGACTTMPTGPSLLVLPGTGMSFDQFRTDDMVCRQFALDQSGGATANQAAAEAGARSAAAGAALGAVAGAAIGGSRGAGVGAGTGLAVGGLAGTGTGQTSAYGAQRRYDNGYVQCMYAKGHRVPVSGNLVTAPAAARHAAPPPPPPGLPPPPPPGAPVR